jgi:DNA-binding transcriptional regulator YdaS (Cro superfamily)|tara:strand:- start:679 stop:879 length:201 start_codon:yes stop_codon:yes gene_type:complete
MEEIKMLLQAEFGTLDELSKLLGVKNTAVYNWIARQQIPIRHIKKLNVLSEGRLTKEMLRPDLFGE